MGAHIKSRTANSLQNTKVSLFFYLLILVTTFFSRKVFINSLGTEILGLNTTITNLLGLLNLSELGIGTAVSFALFKPLLDGNRKNIGEIVSVQGWLYRNIALLIIIVGAILMFFFPLDISKNRSAFMVCVFHLFSLPDFFSFGLFYQLQADYSIC